MDEHVSVAWELLADAGADPLLVTQACEALVGFIQARQLDAIRQVSLEDPPVIDPTGALSDPAPAEIACALAWTPAAASRRVDLAHDLHDNLSAVLDALRNGLVDLPKAQEIADGTLALQAATRAQLGSRACEYARTHTRGQLRAWLAKQVAALDPEAAQDRRKAAARKRRVWIQPESDGMATLGAYLTAEEAQACYDTLRAAAANHEGGIDAARADLLVERLTGLTPGDAVPVQVIITPTGPELAGYGPLSAAHANGLCAGVPPIRLKTPSRSLSYRPGLTLTRYVRARDRHCRFPGCRRPAVHCDLDHTVAWPVGTTSAENVHCLCRYHHRLKTHTGWQVTRRRDGTLRWTSPRGHRYFSQPDDP